MYRFKHNIKSVTGLSQGSVVTETKDRDINLFSNVLQNRNVGSNKAWPRSSNTKLSLRPTVMGQAL